MVNVFLLLSFLAVRAIGVNICLRGGRNSHRIAELRHLELHKPETNESFMGGASMYLSDFSAALEPAYHQVSVDHQHSTSFCFIQLSVSGGGSRAAY